MSRVIYSWIPIQERGIILGLNFSGSRLGAAFALPLVAYLIDTFGWRNTFLILGLVGVVWAFAWWLMFRDTPEEHSKMSQGEKEYILENRQKGDGEKDILSRKQLFGSKNMWSAIGQYFASNFTFYFALTWLFPYLKNRFQLDSVEAGWYAVAPFIAGAIGNWLAGGMTDSIFKKGKWNESRRFPAIIGFALAAIGMIGSLYMESPLTAILFFSIAIFGADMTLPPSWALCVDIGKKNAGAVSGTMNMAGNLGSFITALAFPYLKDWTGSVDYFFYLAAFLNILAIFLWLRVKADKGLSY
jgi:ACS family glucarate transporter-like MFS transporter